MKISRLRMFAGPNGSGKSTIKDKVAGLNPNWLGVYINPDEIEKSIAEQGFIDLADFKVNAKGEDLFEALKNSTQLAENELLSNIDKLTFRGSKLSVPGSILNSYLVSAIADFLHENSVASKVSFSFETVMSHPKKIELLKRAKGKGFRNYLYFIATEILRSIFPAYRSGSRLAAIAFLKTRSSAAITDRLTILLTQFDQRIEPLFSTIQEQDRILSRRLRMEQLLR